MGDKENALLCYQKVSAIKETLMSPNHPSSLPIYTNIASIHLSTEQKSDAVKYFEKSLQIQETLPSPDYLLTHVLPLQHAERCVSEARSALGSDHQTVKATQDYIESIRRVAT
ncbi:unnamed protein product [Rotaria magnacalcarata]|uniref:Kinesin light chain n=2 Tax=Rotaria magnacalcarata TaxID=392030 RepID=A0A8S3E1I2_9BILA|nr:unnamed protein product [Rotaria magnacalcarata]